MGHLLACTLITILMDWDRSDSSACVTLTGREGGRAEETGVKAGLDEGDYRRGKTATFGFRRSTSENVSFHIFSKLFLHWFWVVRQKISQYCIWREFREHFSRALSELFRLTVNVHQVTLRTEEMTSHVHSSFTRWRCIFRGVFGVQCSRLRGGVVYGGPGSN